MPDRERADKLISYGKAAELLAQALLRYPVEMWHFKPESDQWSIHEILVHIADSEANSYVRCRRLIAEPGEGLMAYDENRWAKELGYARQSTQEALELFRWLRLRSHALIKDLPETVWGHRAYHPEDGWINLDDWLNTYERHIPDHIQQMDEVYARWKGEQPV